MQPDKSSTEFVFIGWKGTNEHKQNCIFSKCCEILEYQQLFTSMRHRYCFLLTVCEEVPILVFGIDLSLLQIHSVQCAFTGWGRAARSTMEYIFTDNTFHFYHCSRAQVYNNRN